MSQLQMISRGADGYLGKVFFCCHPEDQDTYLSVISREILQKQNCSVWYAPKEHRRDEGFYEDLKEMQMFVMPVTKRLLTTENEGLEAFRFAQDNGIPVLPLLQEAGLEPLFNSVCGDLHCLCAVNNDSTAIDFDTKLTQFLESVLIGDELAEKVRNAFDAYVFLSYRKKDRRHAQELMRLIHKDPKYRDIAVWYDEFLTPGENFNDSIREQLGKSDLFLLAVTPNLVNEDNYVMREEYPTARKMDKHVLPAEMVETDKNALSRSYQGISQPIDPRDQVQLNDALVKALGELAIRENDSSAEHLFHIGLAYLSGIHVEVDLPRGVELITKAAKDNYEPAMHKLEHMYRNGQGVQRNMRESLYWKQKKTKLLEEKVKDGLLDLYRREMEEALSFCSVKPSTYDDFQVNYLKERAKKLSYHMQNEKVKDWLRSQLELFRVQRTVDDPETVLGHLVPCIKFLEKYGTEQMYQLQDSGIMVFAGSMESVVLDLYILEMELSLEAHRYDRAERSWKNLAEKFWERNRDTWQGRVLKETIYRLYTQMLVQKGEYARAEESRKAWIEALLEIVNGFGDLNTEEKPEPGDISGLETLLVHGLEQAQSLQFAAKKVGMLTQEYGKVAAKLFLAMGNLEDAEDAYSEIPAGLKMAEVTDDVSAVWAYLKMAGLGLRNAQEHLQKAKALLMDMPRTDLRYLPLHRDCAMVEGDLAEDGVAYYEEAFALAEELVQDMPTAENMEALGAIARRLGTREAAQRVKDMIKSYGNILRKYTNGHVLGGLYEDLAEITGNDGFLDAALQVFTKLTEKYPQCLCFQAKRDELKEKLQ